MQAHGPGVLSEVRRWRWDLGVSKVGKILGKNDLHDPEGEHM